MEILLLTIFLSTLLAGFFMLLFSRSQSKKRISSAEHDALLPFLEDNAKRPPTPKA